MNESIRLGIEVMVIGFSVVFVALFLLYAVMWGFNRIFAPREAAPDRTKEKPEALDKTPTCAGEGGLSQEIVAAITGAIAAYLEKPESKFIIRRIETASQKVSNCWLLASRRTVVEQNQELFMLRRERKR